MSTFRVALYTTGGTLVKSYVGEPIWLQPTAQQVADMVARSADAGCTYDSGVIAVWEDAGVEPIEQADDIQRPDALRAFGAGLPPVPAHRLEPDAERSTLLIPMS